MKEQKQLVSSAVSFGTLQLLPSGQLIVLMADHQTTGGYPRVANVISAHLPLLAQSRTNDAFSFAITDIHTAEQKLLQQFNYLQQVQYAAGFKIEKILQ
jgi:antagonist of KipI